MAQPTELQTYFDVLDTLQSGAALLTRRGIVVYANARLAEMMGLSQSELRDANLFQFYRQEEHREALRRTLEHFNESSEHEFVLPRADGTTTPVIYSARRLPGPRPISDHLVVTIIDIGKLKDAERTIKNHYDFIVQMSDTVLQQALDIKRHSHSLEERVRARTADLHEANMDAIYMLAVASEAKDIDTGQHVRRIQKYAEQLSLRLGFDESRSRSIGFASILHDVGKIHIPDEILKKPGPLTAQERLVMEDHTLVGERILSKRPFFEMARKIARSHHENVDGTGYPDRVGGNEIPIEARICHVVDVYDALVNERVYKPAMPPEAAAAAIEAGSGTMFDPTIAEAFLTLIRAPVASATDSDDKNRPSHASFA